MKLSSKSGDRLFSIGLLLPAILIVGLAVFLPVIESVGMSFSAYKLGRAIRAWDNLANYIALFRSGELFHSLGITFLFTAETVVLLFVLGMILAVILNSMPRANRTLRSVALLPWVVPTVISALMWSWMFQPQYGILNYLVRLFGISESPIAWLANPHYALEAVVIAALWRQLPFMFLMLLAGLQTVPAELYEVAQIDGAGFLRTFFNVSLPLLRNIIRTAVLISVINSFKQFPLFWIMTGGGPVDSTTTLAILSYKHAFLSLNFGQGAAVSTVWLVALLLFTLIYNRVFRGQETG